jgi:hypothetical protein
MLVSPVGLGIPPGMERGMVGVPEAGFGSITSGLGGLTGLPIIGSIGLSLLVGGKFPGVKGTNVGGLDIGWVDVGIVIVGATGVRSLEIDL